MSRGSARTDLPPGTLGTQAAAAVAGLHWRTLLRWIDRGVLDPQLFTGTRGTHSATFAWRLHDLIAARTIRELRAAGLSAQKVRKAALTVMRETGRDLSACRLWSDGRDAFRVLPGNRLQSMLNQPGQHLLFTLDLWAQDVEKRFARELRRRERIA